MVILLIWHFDQSMRQHEAKSLPHDLIPDECFELFLAQLLLVSIEVKEFFRDRFSCWLVFWVMVRFQVGVFQGFLDCDSLNGIERQQLLQQVQCKVRMLGEEDLEGNLLFERQASDILSSTSRLDAIVVLHGRRSQHIEDQSELMMIVLTRKEWLAAEHFCKDASHTPYVNSLGILFERQHDFRRSIPPRCNIFRHET